MSDLKFKKRNTKRKYTDKLANEICEDVSKGLYTLESIAKQHGISLQTLHKWKNPNSDMFKRYFYDNFNRAKEESYNNFADTANLVAKKSLLKLAEGYEYEEESLKLEPVYKIDENGNEVYVTNKVVEIKTHKKKVNPSFNAVQFILINTDKFNSQGADEKARPELPPEIDMSKLSIEDLRTLKDIQTRYLNAVKTE